jgi:hypothetical protein
VPRTTVSDFLLEYLRAVIPEVARRADEDRSEHIQTGAWLVGLASALLALFLANRDKVPFVSESQAKLVVVLLGLSIMAGVVQRIVLLIGSGQDYAARMGFVGWLKGLESDADLAEPLKADWTNDEIVSRLKRHYDLDYEFLLKSASAEAELGRVYSEVYESWDKFDRESIHALMQQLGNWIGWTEAEIERRSAQSAELQLDAESPQRIHFRTLYKIGGNALIAASLTFCAAVIVFCVAFLF